MKHEIVAPLRPEGRDKTQVGGSTRTFAKGGSSPQPPNGADDTAFPAIALW